MLALSPQHRCFVQAAAAVGGRVDLFPRRQRTAITQPPTAGIITRVEAPYSPLPHAHRLALAAVGGAAASVPLHRTEAGTAGGAVGGVAGGTTPAHSGDGAGVKRSVDHRVFASAAAALQARRPRPRCCDPLRQGPAAGHADGGPHAASVLWRSCFCGGVSLLHPEKPALVQSSKEWNRRD